jgi:hypothetical protein
MTEREFDLMKELERDGKFIVFEAPEGYRFGDIRAPKKGEFIWSALGRTSYATPVPNDWPSQNTMVLLLPTTPPPVLTCEAPTVESVYRRTIEQLKAHAPGFFASDREVRFGDAAALAGEGFNTWLSPLTGDPLTNMQMISKDSHGLYRLASRPWKGSK